jgi:hypothetical protein
MRLVLALLCLLVVTRARAQEPAPEGPKTPLGWWWQHTTPVPILFYSPENQFGFGAGAMTTWLMPRAYPDRPSSVIAYGIYTTRRQTIAGAAYELRFHEDRHVWLQEFRFIDWPDRFYGFGNDTKAKDRDDYKDHYMQLESEYQHRAFSHLYVGLRHVLRASRTLDVDDDGTLSNLHPNGMGKVFWSGLGPVLLWDDRKGLFWPKDGNLFRFDTLFYRPYFGADFSSALMRLDLRRYQPLWLDHVLAMRLITMAATGETPFQQLPALGGPNMFRGWYLGRLRDRVLLASELEYRVPISTRFSAVAFGSVGRVARSFSELNPKGFRGTGGAGVRVAVRPENRANFRLDFAYGDQFYVYFQFKEAF